MAGNSNQTIKPLVVGSPRSGFALLCSVIAHLSPMAPRQLGLRQQCLRIVANGYSHYIAKAIDVAFADAGIDNDLIFNQNFRNLTGGPNWLRENEKDVACVRKYIGVRGLGDFTLVVAHPHEILEIEDIVHSHSHPRRWIEEPYYDAFTMFASVRNPVGIINSSLFSINALTSEYIQRFLPPDEDNDQMRQSLALFKFTNLDFFEGIVRFYKRYFDEFMAVRSHYNVMRWEDLIQEPAQTIRWLAETVDLPVDLAHATQIWQRIDHVNLTGAHKHNFRKGGGKVGDWTRWMTNHHLEIIRDHGLEDHAVALGYEPLPTLSEGNYTDFQKHVADLVRRGDIFDDYADRNLFEFAFNKSNLDSENFSFRRYDWKSHTRVERSSFGNEDILHRVWRSANVAAGELNAVFRVVLDGAYGSQGVAARSLDSVRQAAEPLSRLMPKAHQAVDASLAQLLELTSDRDGGEWEPHSQICEPREPRLIRGLHGFNIVSYAGNFYGVPQSAGPIDLRSQSVVDVPHVVIESSYRATYDRIQSVASER